MKFCSQVLLSSETSWLITRKPWLLHTEFIYWWLVRVTLVVDWRFLPQNFGQVVGTYEGFLPFCECTWGGGSIFRWWGHLNTFCLNQTFWPFCTERWWGTKNYIKLHGHEASRPTSHLVKFVHSSSFLMSCYSTKNNRTIWSFKNSTPSSSVSTVSPTPIGLSDQKCSINIQMFYTHTNCSIQPTVPKCITSTENIHAIRLLSNLRHFNDTCEFISGHASCFRILTIPPTKNCSCLNNCFMPLTPSQKKATRTNTNQKRNISFSSISLRQRCNQCCGITDPFSKFKWNSTSVETRAVLRMLLKLWSGKERSDDYVRLLGYHLDNGNSSCCVLLFALQIEYSCCRCIPKLMVASHWV